MQHKNLYSNSEDCFELTCKLYPMLGEKFKFEVSPYNGVISGKYYCLSSENFKDYREKEKSAVAFAYKYCKDGFLRINISNTIYKTSMGNKLAALSNFYLALKSLFGMPTLFYTTKDDDEDGINLEWDFKYSKETINEFKNDTMFDDASVDKLIVFGEDENLKLNPLTIELISDSIGLPYELIPLINENILDYIYYKKGNDLKVANFENFSDNSLTR